MSIIVSIAYFTNLRLKTTTEFEVTIQNTLVVITSISTSSAAIISFYHWVWAPHQKSKRKAVDAYYLPSRDMLEAMVKEIEQYSEIVPQMEEFDLDALIEDIYAPRDLHEKLKSLKNSIKDYNEWSKEATNIIRTKVEFSAKKYDDLRNDWLVLGIGSLDNLLNELVRIPIIEGKLDYSSLKEKIYEDHGRNLMKKVESKNVALKEIIESDEFHRIVRSLKDLEKSPSVTMLRSTKQDVSGKICELQHLVEEKIHACE